MTMSEAAADDDDDMKPHQDIASVEEPEDIDDDRQSMVDMASRVRNSDRHAGNFVAPWRVHADNFPSSVCARSQRELVSGSN